VLSSSPRATFFRLLFLFVGKPEREQIRPPHSPSPFAFAPPFSSQAEREGLRSYSAHCCERWWAVAATARLVGRRAERERSRAAEDTERRPRGRHLWGSPPSPVRGDFFWVSFLVWLSVWWFAWARQAPASALPFLLFGESACGGGSECGRAHSEVAHRDAGGGFGTPSPGFCFGFFLFGMS
jgi:hypothetical protein